MLWFGIDDTDTLDSPGTNKLALHLVAALADTITIRLVARHQLFFDPRVPYTSHNGAASLLADVDPTPDLPALFDRVRSIVLDWSPAGSDPGLCMARQVPTEVIEFGLRCQCDVVSQAAAHETAARNGILLEGLAGTGDGAIGALAAVGLLATEDDGRVLHYGTQGTEAFDVLGSLRVEEILRRGVSRVENMDTGEPILSGNVALAKRLRPNLRRGKLVLYVRPDQVTDAWQAVEVV